VHTWRHGCWSSSSQLRNTPMRTCLPQEAISYSQQVIDAASITQDLSPTICTEIVLHLREAAKASKGVRFIATCIRKLADWRAFFLLLMSAPTHIKPKLLTHSGHGNVSNLLSDIPLGRAVSASTAMATIRRMTGAPCLGMNPLFAGKSCPRCGISTSS
jgi:hypothetical protein